MVWMSTMVLVQHGIVEVAVANRLGPPRVERGGRHLHHPEVRGHRQVRAALGEEGNGRTFSRAK